MTLETRWAMIGMAVLIGLIALILWATGASAIAAEATLQWDPNTENDLSGYRIFRATQGCDAAGPLAPLLNASGQQVQVGLVSTYVDSTVPVFDGTLCYEIVAVDTAGNVSLRSNRAAKDVNLVPPQAPRGARVNTVTP